MNELTIANPRGNADAITKARADIMAYQRDLEARIVADAAEITADNYRAHKKSAFDAEVKRFSECAKGIANELARESGADAVFVQLKASENICKAALKERAAKWDACKPAEREHTYVIRMTCTDAVLDSLMKKAVKDGAKDPLVGVPQTDKAVKQIMARFEANV